MSVLSSLAVADGSRLGCLGNGRGIAGFLGVNVGCFGNEEKVGF